MSNEEHLQILQKGISIWNQWRRDNPRIRPDLNNANLRKIPMSIADLKLDDLLDISILGLGDQQISETSEMDSMEVDLRWANLCDTNLEKADLRGQYLRGTKLNGSNLKNAQLEYATLIDTDLDRANLSGCRIYGISVWSLKGEPLDQSNLIVSRLGEPIITVDNLELAQFIYLLLNHKKLRDVINAVTKRGVLILGRFQDGGLEILQSIAAKLRDEGYLPIIYDFSQDARTTTETVITLVGLSRFVIVDLSGPSVPQELYATVQNFDSIPFVPILEEGRNCYSMFKDLLMKCNVLNPIKFKNKKQLADLVRLEIIEPAEKKCEELQRKRMEIYKTYNSI